MKRVAIRDNRNIFPFNEPARELRIMNKPLKVHQRDCLVKYCDAVLDCDSLSDIPRDDHSEMVVYQDNVFFDQPFIDSFVTRARKHKVACRVAFEKNDMAITAHALHLQDDIHLQDDLYVGNLWYFPNGIEDNPKLLVTGTQAQEIGYHIWHLCRRCPV
jgi:hypothetical protein